MFYELNMVFNKGYIMHCYVIRISEVWKASRRKEHNPIGVIPYTK